MLFLLPSGRGGSSGAKFRISLGLPVGAVINCADNTGTALNFMNVTAHAGYSWLSKLVLHTPLKNHALFLLWLQKAFQNQYEN